MYAREVIVVQLELLGPVVREAPAVSVNAMVRADLVDLMARCLVAVFQAEGGRLDDRPTRIVDVAERKLNW